MSGTVRCSAKKQKDPSQEGKEDADVITARQRCDQYGKREIVPAHKIVKEQRLDVQVENMFSIQSWSPKLEIKWAL